MVLFYLENMLVNNSVGKAKLMHLTMSVFRSALSAGFFFKHRLTKSVKPSLNIPGGNFGGGSLTM
jgi:hypothetical protein